MLKKLIRTLQTQFPFLLESKFFLQRKIRGLLRRPFEQDFAMLREMQFAEGEVFVDIGANRGQSIDAIRLYFSRTPIVAFEPNPVLYGRLAARFSGQSTIRLVNAGLSDAVGQFNLFIPVYNGWMFDGLASFDRASAESWLNRDTIMLFDRNKLRVDEVSCKVDVLDDYQLNPGFIKIDVQGLEHKVVLGGAATIARCRPVLLIETESASSALEASLPENYVVCAYENGSLQIGKRGDQNTLYFPRERLDAFSGARSQAH